MFWNIAFNTGLCIVKIPKWFSDISFCYNVKDLETWHLRVTFVSASQLVPLHLRLGWHKKQYDIVTMGHTVLVFVLSFYLAHLLYFCLNSVSFRPLKHSVIQDSRRLKWFALVWAKLSLLEWMSCSLVSFAVKP